MPDEKLPRAKSIMGDDERATQPRPRHPPPIPVEVDPEFTPPPIVIDDVGRPLSRARRPSPHPETARGRMTMQEVVDELWAARKMPDVILQLAQRQAALEARQAALEDHGPAQVAATQVSALRAELVGQDGDGGIVGHLAENVARDLADHRKVVNEVDARATAADAFVRKTIRRAAGAVAGSLVAAAIVIFSAGSRLTQARADVAAEQAQLEHEIELLETSLTDLRGQVKLLLAAQIGHKP